MQQFTQKGLWYYCVCTMNICKIYSDVYLRGSIFDCFKPILVHDPISFLSIRSSPFVENEGLSHANEFGPFVYWFVSSRGLPKPCHGSSVGSCPRWIFLIFVAKEIPLILLLIPNPASLCQTQIIQNHCFKIKKQKDKDLAWPYFFNKRVHQFDTQNPNLIPKVVKKAYVNNLFSLFFLLQVY